MKVFISWSGEASRRVAELLREYLPCMIQNIVPFMSQHDLVSGGRWDEQLSKELDESAFGIVCLTPDNLANPWILFEAGALTKHIQGRACCLLLRGLGPADVSGPLSRFQNSAFTRDGFRKLLFDINDLLERRLERSSLEMIFEKWWGDLDRKVSEALAGPGLELSTEHKRDQADLLEELLLRVRDIQRALEIDPVTESAARLKAYAEALNGAEALARWMQGKPEGQPGVFLGFKPSSKLRGRGEMPEEEGN